MTTTVHLPPDLLESVDRRAGERRMSRNRYIIQALRRAVEEEEAWSPELLDELAAATQDLEGHTAVEEMRAAITSARSRKGPPEL